MPDHPEAVPELPSFDRPIDGALYMLKRGFHVLPLQPNAKLPLHKHWPDASRQLTSEILEATDFNDDLSPVNFGVHPGPSGHFVLDIDCGEKNGVEGKGLESLAALVALHGNLPKTFTVETATGGLHLYFKGQVANTVGTVGVNLDTRCVNGFAVGPGSVIDGASYRIVDAQDPVPAPEWLIAEAQPKAQPLDRPEPENLDQPDHLQAVVDYLENDAPPAILGQGGDAQLFRVFCQCRDLGATRETGIALAEEHYNPRCEPPWDLEDEADRNHFETKARNAWAYAQNTAGAKTADAATASAIADFAAAPLPPNPAETPVAGLPLLTAASIEALAIPKRDWIVKGFLLGAFLSITGAPGGTGKSNFEILKAFSVVTGRPLLGANARVIRRGAAILYNCEDPLDEIIRRVEAFRVENLLGRGDLRDLHLVSGRDHSLSVAAVNKAGEVLVNQRAVATLIATVKSVGAVFFSADPMVRTHWLNENDNMAMDKVTQAFQRVSTETGCAVSLVHHTNKASMGKTADSSSQVGFRGAGSMVASARVGHLLTTMDETEAKKLGVRIEKRRWFFKVENAKANLSPPADRADWFEARGVTIANGETVGVCRRVDLLALPAAEPLRAEEKNGHTPKESGEF